MTERLRIIQVVNVRWFNATAWYGLYLSRLLQEAGHEVVVLGLPGTASYEKGKEWGLDMRPFSNSTNPIALCRQSAQLDELLDSFRPHVVNCHRGENYILWCLKRRKGNRFALVRTRGDQRPPAGGFINRWLYNKMADAVIVTNSAMADRMRESLLLPEDMLHVILGGVDRQCFRFDPEGRALVRAALGFGDDDLVYGLLGRFDPVKGHKGLVRAAAAAENIGVPAQKVRLLFIGRPANMTFDELQVELDIYNVEGRIVMPGHDAGSSLERFGIPAFLSAFDVGVVNSQGSETIARAALEIMSCGVPLVGTDVGVMPDLLDFSAMVKAGDVEALAGLLKEATNENFRKMLADAQKELIKSLSGQCFLEKTLEVYRKALPD